MRRFILRRLALGTVSLWLLSVVVFAGAQILPGSPGRALLGPYASPEVVAAVNRELGYDRPVVVRYLDWLTSAVRGDLGRSYIQKRPVVDLILPAVGNSLRLAGVALALVIPISLVGGVYAAYNRGKLRDRIVTVGGMALTVIPEFVTGIFLLLALGIWLKVLPISATPPPNTGFVESLRYLILPALALAATLFGYIARVARAGTVEVLNSDYTRTAVVKGVRPFDVLRRHVLRNALLPTITVIATQIGYMVGGLVVIERLFNYQGLGLLIFNGGQAKDFAVLQAAVMLIGVLYLGVTLGADLLQAFLNPRVRAQMASR
jgi:peptide/nickel transport system permease protein